jgi:hypothetical protein
MLIQTDHNELGDKRLDVAEGIAKLKEDNKALLATKKIADQADLENREAALGQVLPTSEFIQLLKRICPGLIVEPGGYPNAVALRRWVNGEKKYVSGFKLGYLPEFSYIHTDEHGLPTEEVRGWRAVLTALTKQGLISFEALQREHISTASNTVHGKFWDSQLKGHK